MLFPSGPATTPEMLRKFKKLSSLLTASTTTCPLLPSRFVSTSKSLLIGGRETDRTTCAQNLLKAGDCTHCGAHLPVASLVKTADLPRPACQCAKIGSCIGPADSGILTFGSASLLVSTMPNIGAGCPSPRTISSDASASRT